MKKLSLIFAFFLLVHLVSAQSIKNTSYSNQSGEKVLRLEMVIPLGIDKAWELFSTDEGLQKWIAPLAHIDLKAGGNIVTNYDATKTLDDSTSIKLPIVSFLDKEMMILKVNLNNSFSAVVRKTDDHLFEIIQLKKIGDKRTAIVSSMVGFGGGAEWEKVYQFFLKGNGWTYDQLANVFKDKQPNPKGVSKSNP